MFSLHRIDFYIFEHLEDIFILNNVLPFLLSFLFFIYLLYTLIFIDYNKQLSKVLFFFKYWIFLGSFFLFFFIKLYVNFKLGEFTLLHLTHLYLYKNIIIYFNYFGDTLILLCITTLVVSWIFLSERYLTNSNYNIFYFFIFIILTINMVYSTNLLIMFIFFEFIFLPSLFFVYLLGYSKKVEKTIKYLLVWTLTGSFIVLVCLAYIQGNYGSLEIEYLRLIKFSFLENTLLYFLILLGFGIKIPLWPFHYWLTKVHVEAPTGFSIFLSGYLVKTALFCLIFFINIFKSKLFIYITLAWVIWGSIEASIRMWSSTDIKRLIAFATIQEMNLILIFVFLTSNTFYKILNTFILVHGLLSALLFFLVDQIQKRYHTRNLCSLSGLSYYLNILPFIIWLAILIFRGFPIFSKFLIEWEVLTLLYENWSYIGVIFFFLISIFGVLGFCRIWFIVLYGQPSESLNYTVDIIKSDKLISLYIISFLYVIGLVIFLFKDLCNIL